MVSPRSQNYALWWGQYQADGYIIPLAVAVPQHDSLREKVFCRQPLLAAETDRRLCTRGAAADCGHGQPLAARPCEAPLERNLARLYETFGRNRSHLIWISYAGRAVTAQDK